MKSCKEREKVEGVKEKEILRQCDSVKERESWREIERKVRRRVPQRA